MLQLRLTQHAAGEGLRWYLEDYLQYPQEPAPAIARRIEGRLAEVGTELFRALFQASDERLRRITSGLLRVPKAELDESLRVGRPQRVSALSLSQLVLPPPIRRTSLPDSQ
jgi:hypothetical protein